jgi:hypothetical protein
MLLRRPRVCPRGLSVKSNRRDSSTPQISAALTRLGLGFAFGKERPTRPRAGRPRVAPRDNPFAAQRLGALRYRLAGQSWEELLARLEGLGFRAAIVGGEGRGKTTLLAELGERLAERGFRLRRARLALACRRLSAAEEELLLTGLSTADLLLVDSADQLSSRAWARLARRARPAGGLVVTAHRAGLLPTLVEATGSPALLAELVRELLARAVAAPGVELPPAEELFARHAGNLRDALLELYDRCAGRLA